MKKLVYTKLDGSLCVVHPVPKEHLEVIHGPITDQEYMDRVISKSIPEGTYYEEIDEVPLDRTFRGAWIIELGKIKECPIKSRELIREKRNKKLEELDGRAYAESRKPDGDVALIDAKAQVLRDIPERIEFKTGSIADLKQIVKEIEEI